MKRGETAPLKRYFSGRITPAFFAHLFKAVCKRHHRELIPLFRRIVPADAIIFDVGAHAGQFTKLFARLAPQGFVFAVEPQSYARTILRLAIFLNRLSNVAILPLGLGDKAGVALLALPVKRSGSYGFGLAHIGEEHERKFEAEAVALATIDELAAVLRLDRLDLIKADIEGFELRLLKGARQTLLRLRPALYLEMNAAHLARAGDTLEEAWEFLSELGYRPHDPGSAQPLAPPAAICEGDILWLAKE
jgi:FkbM family methyltransferase